MRVEVDRTGLGIECGEGLERGSGAGDQLALDPGGDGGDVVDADASVGRPLDGDDAVGDLEVRCVRLELAGGDVEHTLARLLGRVADGVAADERPA